MKKLFLFFFIFISINRSLVAQSVGVGTQSPDPSAILEAWSNNKGILLPRVHLNGLFDTITVLGPAVSLLVYNTNTLLEKGKGFYVWNGNNWEILMSSGNLYIKGRNDYVTMVDGDEREYIVNVPTGYDDGVATPVVFMLHGTSGDGERMFNTSGWREVGEAENIITVFPSSWKYTIIDGGTIKRRTKWNVLPDASFTLTAGQTGRDDIKFLRRIITELNTRFNIDTNRIYLEGFSNGGQMAAKCAIEMGDKFAAIASNSGAFWLDTIYTPVRKLPVLFQVGNEDFGPGVTAPANSLADFDSLLNNAGNYYYDIKRAYVRNFGLDSNFTLSGNNIVARVADFLGTPGDTLNVFRMILVKDLAHQFPNGENHWMEAAAMHWNWMRQFRKPD